LPYALMPATGHLRGKIPAGYTSGYLTGYTDGGRRRPRGRLAAMTTSARHARPTSKARRPRRRPRVPACGLPGDRAPRPRKPEQLDPGCLNGPPRAPSTTRSSVTGKPGHRNTKKRPVHVVTMDGAAGDAKERSGLDESLSTPLPRDLPQVVRDAQDL
jgi:hypothetical protein